MNLLTALLGLVLVAPQIAQKATPPEDPEVRRLEKEIKRSDWYPKKTRKRLSIVANAIEIGSRAGQARDTDQSWAAYGLAIKQANSAGELTLSHTFARRMADLWEVPPEFLLQWHAEAQKRGRNQAQVAELALLFLEDVKKLHPGDPVEEWDKVAKKLNRTIAKSRSEFTALACAKTMEQTAAWLWIAGAIRDKEIEGSALKSILNGNIEPGLRWLSQSKNKVLAEAAKIVGESNANFSGAHQRLLESLAASKNPAASLAARKLLETWAPKLEERQIIACQEICYGITEPALIGPDFALPFFGMPGNYIAAEKAKTNSLGWDEQSGSWLLGSNTNIDWPKFPYECYVSEFDMVIAELSSRVRIVYGEEDSVIIHFERKENEIEARLMNRSSGRTHWRGREKFEIGKPLKIRMYRTPETVFVWVNDKRMDSVHFGLCWGRIRLSAGKDNRVVVSRIATRPWLVGDREVLLKRFRPHPTLEAVLAVAKTPTFDEYLKYVQSCVNVSDEAAQGKAFITPMEIVMQPIRAGKFERGDDSRTVLVSNDYWCSAHEITQMQFSELVGHNPASTQGNPYLPVDNVSLTDAVSFCEELTKVLGKKGMVPDGYEYRLPTEAEWTLAAMADGRNDMDVPKAEWWNWETVQDGFHMVGTSTPSQRGIFDMHGNVEELTFDKFQRRDKKSKDTNDIVDPFQVPGKRSSIVIKGGSWNVGVKHATAKHRDGRHRSGAPGRGFRVVLAPAIK